MTLNLKLVRHHDGKWTALTPESDDLSQVSVTEKKSAPIDPAQLLKALDSLLSPDGGIRSVDDVPRLASLMKKFSKKLVSRCVYCNVLQATKPEILSEYLDKGGWETINTWLQYAKSSSSDSFLLEMLKLCKLLPMTLNRLKENNTAKLIKSLTKHENNAVKEISAELVSQWMSIIKVKEKKVAEQSVVDKKKKKEKPSKVEKGENAKDEEKPTPKPASESPKGAAKLKGVKRPSSDHKETKPAEIYEDVKIDPEPLMPVSKKPRADRPKTAKIYQKKFRATGLEEETPLPKNISKKTTTVDKTAVAAAKSALKVNSNPLDRILEKKIKPENLMAINENANSKGIKLIPAKPRPTYVLHESASFIDALISQPVAPVKRKKKVPPKPPAPHPTSPTISPPKLQFYKDTLEEKMTDESKKDETKDETGESDDKAENAESESATNSEENVPMDTTEEGGHTPPNEETNEMASPVDNADSKDDIEPKEPLDPNQLRSILSHGRRRGKKKSVRWVHDSNIKEVFYFEMDDTERVNVSRNQNFYDLKSIEMKREREAMELAKRQAGDRVEEFRKWWAVPILIDVPPPLVIPGSQSQEKHVEIMRQQSTLQEIYFTREMIPDSPHEPDLEIVAPKEPKVIPLDEENLISTVNDYSNFKPIKAALPDILTSLMKLNASQLISQVNQNPEPAQIPMDAQLPPPQLINPEPISPQNLPLNPMPQNQPFEPVLEPPHGTPNGLLGHGPPVYNSPPQDLHNSDLPGEWQGPEGPPNDQFFGGGGYPLNQNMPHNPPHGPGMRGHGNFQPNYRGGPRGMGGGRPRNRKLCRHFAAGHCRFGINCTFLHPGINGPPL